MKPMLSQITDVTSVCEPFVQAQIKENIKAPRHSPLWGEFTGDRWIPRIKGQLGGKCFPLMTSSWNCRGASFVITSGTGGCRHTTNLRCRHPAGTRRNNNVFTTSTRRRRRRVDVMKPLSLRHYCVMCPLGGGNKVDIMTLIFKVHLLSS